MLNRAWQVELTVDAHVSDIDIGSWAPELRMTDNGVWLSPSRREVSFSRGGHAGCYALEDDSFWFEHRNAVLLAALSRFAPTGVILDVGGGNGYVTRALVKAGHPAVLLEPGEVGVRNAQARGLRPIICSSLQDAGILPGVLPAVGLFDAVPPGIAAKRPLVPDLVAAAVAFGDLLQQEGEMPPVVRMRGGAAGDLAQIVAGDHRVGVGSADPARRFRHDPAGAHVTDASAQAAVPKGALGPLRVHTGEAGAGAFGLGLLQGLE